MLRLIVRCGSHFRSFPAPAGEVRLGSSADNDLVLPYAGVSGHHAVIQPRDRGIVVKDLGSKNGLLWQGQRVSEARLRVGQIVQLGYATLELEEISTSEGEIALSLDQDSGARLSTLPVAGETDLPADGSSPAAALHVVRELEATSDFDLGRHAAVAGEARRALGASSLVVFRLAEDGDLAFLGCNGSLPADDRIRELAAAAARIERPLPATELLVGGEPCLLTGSGTTDACFLAALFSPRLQLTEWRRDFFEYLARAVLTPEKERAAVSTPQPPAVLRFSPDVVLGDSPALRKLLKEVEATVDSDLDVLLLGETGTGKEVFARMIHASGPSAGGPFVPINCAAIPAELLEAELFGVAPRVATGVDPRPGRFLQADGGTLFLDEVGELTEPLQAKLLRVLQEREVLSLGASKATPIRVRVIGASNRDLEALMSQGDFRADLYYRLAQLCFRLPSLRERQEDIPQLVFHFAGRAARQYGKRIRGVSRKALDLLLAHPWPGNIRELDNLVTKAVLVCPHGGTIESVHLGSSLAASEASAEVQPASALLHERVDALERDAILEALRETRGNKTKAAKRLGLTRNGLDSKMKRLGLSADAMR